MGGGGGWPYCKLWSGIQTRNSMLDSVLKLNSTKLKNFSLIWSFEIALRSEFNRLIVNPTKWSNTLKQFVGNLPTNCLIVFDHFVILALKGLRHNATEQNLLVLNKFRLKWLVWAIDLLIISLQLQQQKKC